MEGLNFLERDIVINDTYHFSRALPYFIDYSSYVMFLACDLEYSFVL